MIIKVWKGSKQEQMEERGRKVLTKVGEILVVLARVAARERNKVRCFLLPTFTKDQFPA